MHRRLCTIVHGPYPAGEPRVARQVRVGLEEGYEVDVVAMRRVGDPSVEEHDGARIIRLPIIHRRGARMLGVLSEYLGFTALASLRVAALACRRRYSVVQVNNPPDFLMVAALVPKLLGARVILDIHDLSPEMFAMRFDGGRGSLFADRTLRAIERWSARVADVVITVHEPYRRELAARSVRAEKTAVVMNSVDERLLPTAEEGVRGDGFRVVYHGTLTPPYGVQLLIDAVAEAAAEVPDVRLEVYGEGDALRGLRERAAALAIAERVRFSERYVPHAEVLEHVRRGDVGVIPNLPVPLNRFALSSKLFEYVALGVPVVSADLPTIREYFSNDELLFFRAGDARSLASALVTVARERDAAAARARAARRRYEQYRWPENARRYAAILNGTPPRALASA